MELQWHYNATPLHIVSMAPNPAYVRRTAARRLDNERRLMGESLAAFHARETAPPPTLAEIYAANHRSRERCAETLDLLAWRPKRSRRKG
jgi:hypothetical protein